MKAPAYAPDPEPWVSRDLYAAKEIELRTRLYRVEVRAWRMVASEPAALVYVTYRARDDRWVRVRDERVPRIVAREGTRLVRMVRPAADLENADFGGGSTIDRTAPSPLLELPLG